MPIALVDLGDTLCDCAPALRKALGAFPEFGDDASALGPSPLYLESHRRRIMEASGFWSALMPSALGFELVDLLREVGFHIHILTKGPSEAPHVWAEKVSWCRAHLPGVPVTVTDDKSLTHGQVLVDDWIPYVVRWQRRWPAGLAILPARPWNTQTEMGPRRVRYDGTNRKEVLAALQSCHRDFLISNPGHGSGPVVAQEP